MRPVLIAALIASLASPALSASKVCDFIPLDMRQEPTVQYDIVALSDSNLRFVCHFNDPAKIWGCASQQGDNYWMIFVDETLEGDNLYCVILHEKAHMPPNRDVVRKFTTVPGSAYRRPWHYETFWKHWQRWN